MSIELFCIRLPNLNVSTYWRGSHVLGEGNFDDAYHLMAICKLVS